MAYHDFVYLICPAEAQSWPRFVKIGVSDRPERRMGTIASEMEIPLRMLGVILCRPDCVLALEKCLHRLMATKRYDGEWFFLGREDVDHVLNSSIVWAEKYDAACPGPCVSPWRWASRHRKALKRRMRDKILESCSPRAGKPE